MKITSLKVTAIENGYTVDVVRQLWSGEDEPYTVAVQDEAKLKAAITAALDCVAPHNVVCAVEEYRRRFWAEQA